MQQITSVNDIAALGTILSVWAHPDDETFTCAGIMAAAIQNGQRVVCVTATKGELGVQDENRWPASRLGEIRAQELAKALEILGVTEHHWLGYIDGSCENVPLEEVVPRLADIIKQSAPDTILTFGPEGMTGHPDHQAVSRWVGEAVKLSGQPIKIYHAKQLQETYDKYLKEVDKRVNIFYNIDKPPLVSAAGCDICFCLEKELCITKCQALKAMPSQTEGMLSGMSDEEQIATFAYETFAQV
jgi:LmbE family N-acetylglucosaminyl deacetylase